MSTQREIADDPCKDVKYKEPMVDSMRAQKDEVGTESIDVLGTYFVIINALCSCARELL